MLCLLLRCLLSHLRLKKYSSKGDKENAGSCGQQVSKEDTGPRGSSATDSGSTQGPKGDTRPQGPQGAKEDKGDAGTQGPKGDK